MKKFTVFTPTYNRAITLGRVYQSLLNQTNMDFDWLIVDDGSGDNTKELVNNWIKEGKINIAYHYKKNGGKHTAFLLALDIVKTKYLIAIDSDDEFTENAIETFFMEWDRIESSNLEGDIAEIRALSHLYNGVFNGNYFFPVEMDYIDSSWHEMVLKNENNNELISCWNTQKLNDCITMPDNIWLSDKISTIGDGVFWSKIGRKYKTRYINKSLLIVHFDGDESLMRSKNFKKKHYNSIVFIKYFLDENLQYYFWNKKYFTNLVIKFIVSGIELGFSPLYVLRNITSWRLIFTFIVFYPFGFVAWFYFRFMKKRFWF
jgi:glycosyltransferase involved in cell wall biosynthesis